MECMQQTYSIVHGVNGHCQVFRWLFARVFVITFSGDIT
jgi:hypothetical protein